MIENGLLFELMALSPLDGRYGSKTKSLQSYFSEYALIKARVEIEVLYFQALGGIGIVDKSGDLQAIYQDFSIEDASRIKEIERTTNHDVKAVEYFLREEFQKVGLQNDIEFIHFGLTSQDINNTAFPLLLLRFRDEVLLPSLEKCLQTLTNQSRSLREFAMLARTHGQPASPTTLGKEIQVFAERLQKAIEVLKNISIEAKFGGATGNFNAHAVAYPKIDWPKFADKFVGDLGLIRQQTTSQIEHYDSLAAFFHACERINTILVDCARDLWQYISLVYFAQKTLAGEVGSSAMPHKVNPIDFENAEGNLLMANAVFHFLASKLPISRLQRDLTDSTVLRNIGVPFGHMIIGLESLEKGFSKLEVRPDALQKDLDANWSVLAEAIQTVLRRERYPDPYNALKALTRGQTELTKESLAEFIDLLDINQDVKDELLSLTPENYVGYAKD